MKNSDLLAEILRHLADGATVYVSTCLRVTRFEPAFVALLKERGYAAFRLTQDGALWMYEGCSRRGIPRYVTIATGDGILLVGLKFEPAASR